MRLDSLTTAKAALAKDTPGQRNDNKRANPTAEDQMNRANERGEMESLHTPGPWRIVIDGTCSGAWPFIGPADLSDEDLVDCSVAELGTTHIERRRSGVPGSFLEKPERFKPTFEHDTIMANARLIAAAPDLLAALQLARSMCGLKGEVHRIIDAALAKATGANA